MESQRTEGEEETHDDDSEREVGFVDVSLGRDSSKDR